jgi:hypothetical protein
MGKFCHLSFIIIFLAIKEDLWDMIQEILCHETISCLCGSTLPRAPGYISTDAACLVRGKISQQAPAYACKDVTGSSGCHRRGSAPVKPDPSLVRDEIDRSLEQHCTWDWFCAKDFGPGEYVIIHPFSGHSEEFSRMGGVQGLTCDWKGLSQGIGIKNSLPAGGSQSGNYLVTEGTKTHTAYHHICSSTEGMEFFQILFPDIRAVQRFMDEIRVRK